MIQSREVQFCKEADDVLALLVNLVADIKAGKNAGAIMSENVSGLIEAVSGCDQIGVEEKNRKVFMETIGYRTGDLADALLG